MNQTIAIDWKTRQSELISAMRFPLIVLVVFGHVLPEAHCHVGLDFSGMWVYNFISEMISHNMAKVRVPCFFIFSGYFFFLKMEKMDIPFYKKQIKRRFESLMIPYVIWNTVALLAGVVVFLAFSLLGVDSQVSLPSFTPYNWYWGCPVDYPLWFMRDLFCMALLSPVFYMFFKHVKVYGLMILFILYLLCVESHVPGLSTTAFLFFGIGAFFGMNRMNILQTCNKIKTPSYIIAALLLVVATIFNDSPWHEYVARLFAPFGIISTFNLADLWVERSPRAKSFLLAMSSTTFFIYATHEIFIINWTKGFFARTFLAESAGGLLISYFMIPAITVTFCLVIYYSLNKFFPEIMRVATGGRAK